jgi:hypothetical protein
MPSLSQVTCFLLSTLRCNIMTTPDNSPAPRSKLLLAWMIVSQIVSVLVILAAAALFVFGVLLGTMSQFSYVAIYASPLLLLIPIIGSWVAFKRRNEKLAWILTSVPVIYLCLELAIVGVWTFI